MKPVDHIFGQSETEFAAVERVFRKNFADGWEREGAECAVYFEGRQVVDLQGGFKDRSANVLWTDQTRTVVFSVTKSVAALVIAHLVDKDVIRYEQKIAEFWPAFGRNGKETITVEHVMTHRAGLVTFGAPISLEAARSPTQIAKLIEEAAPVWQPGTKTGYHALTSGWLIDQIVRHADAKARSVAQYFGDEIGKPHDIDFSLGIAPDQESSVSRLRLPSLSDKLREIRADPRLLLSLSMLWMPGRYSVRNQMEHVSTWMEMSENRLTVNNPELHHLEQVAALGITKARALAKLFALVLDGQIVSSNTAARFNKPQFEETDVAMRIPVAKGHGFMFEPHPYKRGEWLYGHPGFGGSAIIVSPSDRLVVCYVSNGLKAGGGPLNRTYRLLRNAALRCAATLASKSPTSTIETTTIEPSVVTQPNIQTAAASA